MDYIESFGAIPSPKDVRDYTAVCTASAADFPEEFELSMPAVKNQGRVGACVAHTLATTIEYFNRLQGDGTEEMSVGFIYGNRGEYDYDGKGMVTSQALNRVQKCGCVTAKRCNVYSEAPEIVNYIQGQLVNYLIEAYPNRITSYYRLTTDDEIKASLMQNGPVIFAMNWFKDINVTNGIIKTNGVKSDSSHALVIYGWNQDGWKIQNSWGTSWGNGGRAILPYTVQREETWGIIDTYSENMRIKQEEHLKNTVSELMETATKQEAHIVQLLQRIAELESTQEQVAQLAQLQYDLEHKIAEYDQLEWQYEQLVVDIEKLQIQLNDAPDITADELNALLTEKQTALDALKTTKEEHLNQINELNLQIDILDNLLNSKQAELAEIQHQFAQLTEQYHANQRQLLEYQKEISLLNQELLRIKKPFQTSLGKVLAKILNFIWKIFHKTA